MTTNPQPEALALSTDAEEVARVAKGLSKAQVEWVLNPVWRGSGESQFALVDALETKMGPPMVHMFTLQWDRITPFGLAVRAYLEASK